MEKKKTGKLYIGMQNSPKYEQIIRQVQIKFAPINKTGALKMLLDAGGEKLLGKTEMRVIEEQTGS